MISDKLGSYAAARRQIMPAIEHRSHKGLNNRAENSHLPLRRRERAMQGFRSPGGLQRIIVGADVDASSLARLIKALLRR